MWTCRFIDRRLPSLAGRRNLYSVLRNGAGERRRSLAQRNEKQTMRAMTGRTGFRWPRPQKQGRTTTDWDSEKYVRGEKMR